MADSARVTVNLPQGIHQIALDLAAKEERSLGSICAFAIEAWLHANYSQRLEIYSHLQRLKAITELTSATHGRADCPAGDRAL